MKKNNTKKRKITYVVVFSVLLLAAIMLFSGCAAESSSSRSNLAEPNSQEPDSPKTNSPESGSQESNPPESNSLEPSSQESNSPGWRDIALKDVRTGKSFRISDFDKPVLLESFAVWCPTCTKQQKELKNLHEEIGDDVVSIALNTDPNEDEAKVLEHVERNGFDWYYAVAPSEMTRSLIEEFGINFVNAPQAPVALICNENNARFLPNGVKDVDDLKNEISKGC